ncbi:hypothetical protein [Streptomyces albidus (ex Kaewkla and Franco 2022)]|uniref:hypothetical protein n=1 Tax=Streptomyces albidus (ex Kaewkla and Franco 2022) TaxID=722709 RepID=UPI0015EF73B9|nr:hypothetical protein [Streptomyces albidus (ex Kaewkla and Franco 2022)]
MEPELAALASTAGTTVVTLMATDVWERTRVAVANVWRRVHPERADAVTAELAATREDLLAAETSGDEEVAQELQAEWAGRIRRLLMAQPEVAEELRRLLNELAPGAAPTQTVMQHATASGQARVYQAGRDQHIGET